MIENSDHESIFYITLSDLEELYVIQSKVFHVNVPLIYLLMKYRSYCDYDNVFITLKKLTCCAVPKFIIKDFEMAVIKSLKDCYPNTRVFGCLFYFKQIISAK
ncbi:hypothetical protein DMUE_0142 [Dictyocoela muelleri]|nr:hypothetical protein DMUE_0142 [Dictyocoela muelleri]